MHLAINRTPSPFSISGFELLRNALPGVRHFRLLLGDKPLEAEDIGLRPDSAAYLRHELNAEPFTEPTLHLVEELIRFLRRDGTAVRLYLGRDPHESSRNSFLHAKCYLFYGGRSSDSTLFDHLHPIVGIVGSSNFTGPGLFGNRELNLVHKTVLDASVLGEVVTPRDFNTLKRIADEDNSVIEEQESFLELASSEVLLAEFWCFWASDNCEYASPRASGHCERANILVQTACKQACGSTCSAKEKKAEKASAVE